MVCGMMVALLACQERVRKAPKADPAVAGPLSEVGRRLKEAGEPLGNKPKEKTPDDATAGDDPADGGEAKPVDPVAKAAEGKPGFVYSPHSGKLVDVREFKVGDLVVDPDFADGEKKFFRVPEPLPAASESPVEEGQAEAGEGDLVRR